MEGRPAKFSPPSLESAISRHRLFAEMDDASKGKLCWITASSGFGKTTLVASYCLNRQVPYLWYNIDSSDNDPATLCTEIRKATSQLIGEEAKLPSYHSESGLDSAAFFRTFFRKLFSILPDSCYWIWEDYQPSADNKHLDQVLLAAIEQIPPTQTIIVISRQAPPAILASTFAKSGTYLFCEDMLRFQPEELDLLLAKKHLQLDEHDKKQLLNSSEGWATGISMMIMDYQLRNRMTLDARCHDHSMLHDYFASALFDKLDSRQQTTLLKCSALPYLTNNAVNTLCNDDLAWNLIIKLYRQGYFIQHSSTCLTTLKFHQLTRDFLKLEAPKQLGVQAFLSIQRQAANILKEETDIYQALLIYSHIKQWDAFTDILTEHGIEFITQGRLQTLRELLDKLPTTHIEKSPWLTYYSGMTEANPESALKKFITAFRKFTSSDDRRGIALSWKAYIASLNLNWGRTDEAQSSLIQVSKLFPDPLNEEIEISEALLHGFTSYAAYTSKFDKQLALHITSAEKLVYNTENINKLSSICRNLAIYYFYHGDYHRIQQLNNLMQEKEQRGELDYFSRLLLAFNQYQQTLLDFDLETSLNATNKMIKLYQKYGSTLMSPNIDSCLAYNFLLQDNAKEADPIIEQYGSKAHMAWPLSKAHYHHMRAWSALQQRDYNTTIEQVRLGRLAMKNHPLNFVRMLQNHLGGLAAISMGDWSKAETFIEDSKSSNTDSSNSTIDFYFLMAYYFLRRNNQKLCADYLGKALRTAHRCNITTSIAIIHSIRAELLAFALQNHIETAFATQLILQLNLKPAHKEDEWLWPKHVRITTQGSLLIEVNGKPLQSQRRAPAKLLEILKALIALGGKDVSLNTICDWLWPDSEGDQAHCTLETSIYRLRKMLGKKSIEVADNRISLSSDLCWLDIWQIEHELAELQQLQLLDTVHAERISHRIEIIARLYGEPILSKDDESLWLQSSREHWHRKISRIILKSAEFLLHHRQWPQAFRVFQYYQQLNPDQEQITRNLQQCAKYIYPHPPPQEHPVFQQS
jgi:ATP/maltotriose-dependent transcriptional regulator MalT